MSFKSTLKAFELLDGADVNGEKVKKFFLDCYDASVEVTKVENKEGISTDFIRIVIKGSDGKLSGGSCKTLGITGRLGGIGARPKRIGIVSDADGAVATIATGLKLAEMAKRGDSLLGDVVLTTHICTNAMLIPHSPADFIGSPVSEEDMNMYTIEKSMDAILSLDTSRANRVMNKRGFAITPTVINGYILKVSEDLLLLMSNVTGTSPNVLPITMQDISPYGNGIYHVNSIMQPSIATSSPVVGVAFTSESIVSGCSTGVSRVTDIDEVVRFSIEVAKYYGEGKITFFQEREYKILQEIYKFEGYDQ